MFAAPDLLAVIGAYLIGSIPFGVIVARLKGVNIFTAGSGNIGATNVGRVLGRPYGILVFVLDFLKGAIPAGLAAHWRGGPDAVAVAVGLLTIIGHVFPVYLRLRGGKGVATAGGVMAVLLPGPAFAAALAFVATLLACHFMSLASIAAAIALAGTQLSRVPSLLEPATVLALAVAAIVVIRHRGNIARLWDGTEPPLKGLDRFRSLAAGLHVVALGIWVGTGLFFSIAVAPAIFVKFAAFAKDPPDWLPLADGVSIDLGTRLAGEAIGPLFGQYFLFSMICGLIATGTAIGWAAIHRGRIHRIRAAMLVIALMLVAIGWPISQTVSRLRNERYDADPAISTAARTAFSRLHQVSLFLNLATLAMITPSLALAVHLPGRIPVR